MSWWYVLEVFSKSQKKCEKKTSVWRKKERKSWKNESVAIRMIVWIINFFFRHTICVGFKIIDVCSKQLAHAKFYVGQHKITKFK